MTAYVEQGGWGSKARRKPIGSVPNETSLAMWLDEKQYNRFVNDESGQEVRCDATTVIIGQPDGYLSVTMGSNTGLSSVTHMRCGEESDHHPWHGYHPKLGPISIYTTPQNGKDEKDYPPIELWNLAGDTRVDATDSYGPASWPS